MTTVLLYLLRWQLSTPIIALCLAWLPFSTLINMIIANLIGGIVFFFVDKHIFKGGDKHRKAKFVNGDVKE